MFWNALLIFRPIAVPWFYRGTRVPICRSRRAQSGVAGDDRNKLFAWMSLRGKCAGEFDAVHVWDQGALVAAALAGVRNIVFSPSVLLTVSFTRWLRRFMQYRPVQLVCSSRREHEVYVRRGIHPARSHVIRPGCQTPAARTTRDPSFRALLGFAEGDYVLLAPGESTRDGGHRTAVWTASILHVLDPLYRILLWGRGDDVAACRRMADKLLQPNLLVIAEQKLGRRTELEELLPVADAALFTPNAPSPTLPLAICMAARLPIIATPWPATRELLENDPSAILVPRHSPRLLAQSVLELRQNTSLQSKRSAALQSAPQELFNLDAYVQQYHGLYRQCAST